jgi:hypothetical protein
MGRRFIQIVASAITRHLDFCGFIELEKPRSSRMSVSLSSNTRAALNIAEAGVSQTAAVSALKIAANADKAIVALIEQSAETLKAAAPTGQGRNVDRLA